MSTNRVSIRVWGDFACFTRPEMKVERVSYPIITPSAARGVLEAIFWEPQIYYLIDAVRVVKKGRWVSFRRNEVETTVDVKKASTWMRDPSDFAPIQAGAGVTQRSMLALENVEYIITGQIALTEIGLRSNQKLKKYLDEIARRSLQGKCFHRPALGMREFAANFDWAADPQATLERRATEVREGEDWRQIWPDEDLGLMLYDLFDHELRGRGFRWLSDAEIAQLPKTGQKTAGMEPLPRHEGEMLKPQAAFFHARIKDAKMECHPDNVKMVRRPIEED